MGVFSSASNLLLAASILATGVVYGVDVFFAVVGRAALERSTEAGIADVIGRIHEVADKRMPVIGVTGFLCTIAFIVLAGLGTTAGRLAAVALLGQLTQLGLYLAVAKPVNARLTAAARNGQVPTGVRALQNRWDSVIVPRALAMTIAVGCLVAAALAR